MRFVTIILAVLLLAGCSMTTNSSSKNRLTYYGEIQSVEKDLSAATVYFTQYIDSDGANIKVNEAVIINEQAATLLPKGLAVGDKVKVVVAKEGEEQVVMSITLVSPGNKIEGNK